MLVAVALPLFQVPACVQDFLLAVGTRTVLEGLLNGSLFGQ